MKKKSGPILWILTMFFMQCNPVPKTSMRGAGYFDVDSLVNSQIVHLINARAGLTKTGTLDNETDTATYTPDSAGWVAEFELFASMNINKPVNQGQYKVIEKEEDTSNLKVMEYQHISGDNTLGPSIKIRYYKELINIKSLEIINYQENPVFSGKRTMKMDFEEIGGVPLLKGFSISGNQKMIGAETTSYFIVGAVNL